MSTQAVREYLALVWEQYKLANRNMRSMLPDEVCRNLKMHRKSAIRALSSSKPPRSIQGKGAKTKRRRYSEASKEALVKVWRTMNYIASIRLKPALKDWLLWAELLRKTVGVDPEISICGAKMIVDDAITDGEKMAETLARLGRRFARCNGPTTETAISG